MSSLEQLPVTVFVCVVDVTQAEPFQYWPEGHDVELFVKPDSQLDGAPSVRPVVPMEALVSTRLQLT